MYNIRSNLHKGKRPLQAQKSQYTKLQIKENRNHKKKSCKNQVETRLIASSTIFSLKFSFPN